ncbi:MULTISPECIES: hypothetical protein [unclassified Neisseria]|uniref:hypothetical protein n=1 Tax=unclassified Neisseria TaxID=2623750 RepID=UPI0014317F89|nr:MULTISPECIES: hypothetical protein [unclassified Neisseria]MBF0803975.1 hypothetical protein [Neisseria sp. 19428wB4_WF04]
MMIFKGRLKTFSDGLCCAGGNLRALSPYAACRNGKHSRCCASDLPKGAAAEQLIRL